MADGERITVSLETLRGELTGLELRIVDRLTSALEKKADVAHIDQLEQRVQSLELSRAARENDAATLAMHGVEIERNKRFRHSVPSIAVLSLLVASAALYLTFAHPS